jgi:hypothetical protein
MFHRSVLLLIGLGSAAHAQTTFSVMVNGTTFQVDRYAPAGTGPFPIVALGHGFSNNKDNVRGLAQALLADGAVVVAPQFPLGSGDHARNASVMLAAVDATVTAGIGDAQRLAFGGHSAGALAAWLAAAQRPLTKAVVLLDPVDSQQPRFGADRQRHGAHVVRVRTCAVLQHAEQLHRLVRGEERAQGPLQRAHGQPLRPAGAVERAVHHRLWLRHLERHSFGRLQAVRARVLRPVPSREFRLCRVDGRGRCRRQHHRSGHDVARQHVQHRWRVDRWWGGWRRHGFGRRERNRRWHCNSWRHCGRSGDGGGQRERGWLGDRRRQCRGWWSDGWRDIDGGRFSRRFRNGRRLVDSGRLCQRHLQRDELHGVLQRRRVRAVLGHGVRRERLGVRHLRLGSAVRSGSLHVDADTRLWLRLGLGVGGTPRGRAARADASPLKPE